MGSWLGSRWPSPPPGPVGGPPTAPARRPDAPTPAAACAPATVPGSGRVGPRIGPAPRRSGPPRPPISRRVRSYGGARGYRNRSWRRRLPATTAAAIPPAPFPAASNCAVADMPGGPRDPDDRCALASSGRHEPRGCCPAAPFPAAPNFAAAATPGWPRYPDHRHFRASSGRREPGGYSPRGASRHSLSGACGSGGFRARALGAGRRAPSSASPRAQRFTAD